MCPRSRQLGRDLGQSIEVLSGLTGRERLVVAGEERGGP
jgi:hypothetical protein